MIFNGGRARQRHAGRAVGCRGEREHDAGNGDERRDRERRRNRGERTGARSTLPATGPMTPRSAAQEAAKERGSKALLPSTRSSGVDPPPPPPSGRLRGRPPSRSRRRRGHEAVSTPGGRLRRTRSLLHLRFDKAQNRVDGFARCAPLGRRPPRVHAARRGTCGSTCAAARRCEAARCVSTRPLALQAPEQRVDRALADDREPSRAQALRHLVAVRRLLLDHGEQAEIEHAAQQLRPPAFVTYHASQGSRLCLAAQG